MDASSLKAVVDMRLRADRQASGPAVGSLEAPGKEAYGLQLSGESQEQIPGKARASWRLYVPPYKELTGLMSKRALEEHLKYYAEHFTQAQTDEGMAPFIRSQSDEAHCAASAILHELFFEGLSVLPSPPSVSVQSALINRFNSVDSWWDEMIQVGVLAHGWAVTVVSPKDHQDIQTVLLDPGESNFPPGYMPICAVDCHEHAYWMDHGFDKKRYLEAMKRFINWEALDERFSFATR